MIPWGFKVFGYIGMAENSKLFCVWWVGVHNKNHETHDFMMCKKYETIVRFFFAYVKIVGH